MLLADEVHARELDQPVQQFILLRSFTAAYQYQAKFVHRVHHDGVLIVHGLHANIACVVPEEQKSHIALRKSFRRL